MKKESMLKKLWLFCIVFVMCCAIFCCNDIEERTKYRIKKNALIKEIGLEQSDITYDKNYKILCIDGFEYIYLYQGKFAVMSVKFNADGKPSKCED